MAAAVTESDKSDLLKIVDDNVRRANDTDRWESYGDSPILNKRAGWFINMLVPDVIEIINKYPRRQGRYAIQILENFHYYVAHSDDNDKIYNELRKYRKELDELERSSSRKTGVGRKQSYHRSKRSQDKNKTQKKSRRSSKK